MLKSSKNQVRRPVVRLHPRATIAVNNNCVITVVNNNGALLAIILSLSFVICLCIEPTNNNGGLHKYYVIVLPYSIDSNNKIASNIIVDLCCDNIGSKCSVSTTLYYSNK